MTDHIGSLFAHSFVLNDIHRDETKFLLQENLTDYGQFNKTLYGLEGHYDDDDNSGLEYDNTSLCQPCSSTPRSEVEDENEGRLPFRKCTECRKDHQKANNLMSVKLQEAVKKMKSVKASCKPIEHVIRNDLLISANIDEYLANKTLFY